jgi:hypothetical protein
MEINICQNEKNIPTKNYENNWNNVENITGLPIKNSMIKTENDLPDNHLKDTTQKKKCNKCGIEKRFNEFFKHNTGKNGLRPDCKKCYYEGQKLYIEKNGKKIRRRYYLKNKEKIKTIHKNYYDNNKERILTQSRKYRRGNKIKIQERHRKYHQKNPNYAKNYIKNRKNSDSLYKLICNLRSRTGMFIKEAGLKKPCRTEKLIGCSWKECRKHIENQFKENMNWDNYGYYGWHIDHIIPLSSARTKKELIELCHYTNLQPLWAKDNISKGAKLDIND